MTDDTEIRGGDNQDDQPGPEPEIQQDAEAPSAAPLRLASPSPWEQAANARQLGAVWTTVGRP